MINDNFSPDYTPSPAMHSEVGFDFDGDLGGLRKGPRISAPRLHPAWVLQAATIPTLLFFINPAYGVMFMAGAIIGAVGVLIFDGRP